MTRKPITELPAKGFAFIEKGKPDSIKPSLDFIPRILHDSSVAIIYGPPQSGKTFLALHLLCCAALGRNVFGVKPEQREGLYFALEGEANIKVRLEAWCNAHGETRIPIYYALGRFSLASDDDDGNDVDRLIAYMQKHKIRFLVIDTLSLAMAGLDEISGQQMTFVMDTLHRIKRETGACVVAIAHTGKNEKAGIRGHSSQLGNVDTTIEVVVHNKTVVNGKSVEDDITLSTRRSLYVRKQRDGEANAQESFDLELKDTSFKDARGKVLKAPALHERERFTDETQDEAAKAVKLSKSYREAMDVLADLTAKHDRIGLGAPTAEQFQRVLKRAKWGPKNASSWRSAWERLKGKLTIDSNGCIEHAL